MASEAPGPPAPPCPRPGEGQEKRPARAPWAGYLVAVAATAAALLAGLAARPATGGELEPTLFLLPVALSSVTGGLRPGLAALLLSAVAVSWSLLLAPDEFPAGRPADAFALRWGATLAIGVLICVLAESRRGGRHTEEALRKSHALREAVIRTAGEGICVCYAVAEYPHVRFLVWNDRMTALTGYTMEEINRLGWYQSVYPDPEQQARAAARMARMREGDDLRAEEWEITRKDGERRVLSMSTSRVEMEGGIEAVVALMLDTTARRGAEEQLQRQQQLLAEAQAVAHLGCFEWDIARDHVTWSDELYRIFGLAPQEFGAKAESYLQRLHPEDRPRVQGVLERALRERGSFQLEERIVRADGAVRVLESRGKVIGDDQGRPARLVGACLDVTERRRLEEQLRQSQKMEAVGRLAGGVAHDFNNLLTVINGYSELLLSRLPEEDPNRAAAAAIRDAGGRAARITQQLLAFSRKAVVEPRVLDLNALVRQSAEMLRRLLGEDVVLTTALDPRLGRIRGDAGQIEQVILNLSLNARDAMPQGGRLTLETRPVTVGEEDASRPPDLAPGQYARLTVADTGVGMPAEVMANLFEPFFTTKAAGKGTGLGLAVVHGVVKQSGGHVEVRSEVGAGTIITVLFPVVSPPGPGAEIGEARDQPPRGNEVVLVVEDEAAVRKVIREALEVQGYTVLEAAGGPEAVRVVEAHPGTIALLVTDVVMPEMAGPHLVRKIRERQPGLPVVYVSGHAEDTMFRHGLSGTGDAFLQKPFTPQALAGTVRAVLDDSISAGR